eukprot:scaffold15045_cov66-Phaeocystis_antarctica.AAC.4
MAPVAPSYGNVFVVTLTTTLVQATRHTRRTTPPKVKTLNAQRHPPDPGAYASCCGHRAIYQKSI